MLVEILYQKAGPLRFLSHLELMRAFERAVRRGKIPVAYSEGYNPRPQITHAGALAVGMTGGEERACLKMVGPVDPEDVARRLAEQMPKGLRVLGASALPGRNKANYDLLDRAEYHVRLPQPPDGKELEARIADLLASEELLVERTKGDRTKQIDIRPWIEGIELRDGSLLVLGVKVTPEGQPRPVEILRELGLWSEGDPVPAIHRVGLQQLQARKRRLKRR